MILNLPSYEHKIRLNDTGKREIFDVFRKKYVLLTKEEWVRQHFLHYLIEEKHYPPMLIAVEKSIRVNRQEKRFDAVTYDQTGKPLVLMEFKSPDIRLDQKVMEQAGRYNTALKVRYLIISNGLHHYCCEIDYENNRFLFHDQIPEYEGLNTLKNG